MYVLDIDPLPKALSNPNAFTLADLDFDKGVDRAAFYVPETMTHLYYTPSYQLLDYEDRLTYNHFCGLALCEQFIFLEEHILAPVMHAILRSPSFKLSNPVRDYLQQFIDEEFKHSEMFWRVLETAAPSRYEQRELSICNPHWVRKNLLKLFSAGPQYFQAWIWMALLFEERTIEISRQYKKAENVDSLFKRAHYLHMVEEAQHVELDKIFLEKVYREAPMPVRQMNAHLFKQIMAQYAAPKLTPWGGINAVYEINPEQRANHKQFMRDINGLKHNRAYQEAYYSRRSFPTTFGYLDQFPEMRIMQDAMPGYVPAEVSTVYAQSA